MSPQAKEAPGRNAAPRVVIPHVLPWYRRLVARLIWGLARALAGTLRVQVVDQAGLSNGLLTEPVIFCLWHNRLALALVAYHSQLGDYSRRYRLAAIVSASRDGALVAYLLRLFGMESARGSTSRRGPIALLELARWAARGYALAITPDGPRGPCYQIQPGVIYLAQVTQLPIVAYSLNARRKFCLKSWDRFQVPLPFSSVTAEFAPPLRVPREATESERAALVEELKRRLMSITRD